MAKVFITGGTGYVGRKLIPDLLERGHQVTALARPGSESKLPSTCRVVTGDALNRKSYRTEVPGCDTFLHLVGVAHPSPAKAAQFRAIDQVAAEQAVASARGAGVKHFIYVSVAQPAPIMKAYIEVRVHCEQVIRAGGLNATILRPWYVLGPGHRWPYLLIPVYRVLERIPSTRESAIRLGLVTLEQMVKTLVRAVEMPALGIRIMEVPEIRSARGSGIVLSTRLSELLHRTRR